MTTSLKHLRTVQKMFLALAVMIGSAALASAEPINNSGLSAQECYQKDSGCTQFCGKVTGDMRYECFGICDRMLNHCLDTGDWTDSLTVDPGTGRPPIGPVRLSTFLLRMMMVLGDTDHDGLLSDKEIEALKARGIKGLEPSSTPGK